MAKKKRQVIRKKRRVVKKKKQFGGYVIDFSGREDTLEEVFGKKPITPAQMTKILWTFIKRRRLGGIQ